MDQRPDPADRELLRRALDGRLEPRPDAGHQAARDRLRLPAGRVRRRRAALAAERRRPAHRRVRAEPARARDRPAGRGQRAGDAVRELRLRPVADRAARARRVRLPAPRCDHGADREAARLPRLRDRARRRPGPARRHLRRTSGGLTPGRRPRRGLPAGRIRVRAIGVDAGRLVLLAPVRARAGDPRAQRPPRRHLLRTGPRPHRRRRARRLRRHAVPFLAAVAGGGEHAGAARGAVLPRRRHRPGGGPDRPVRTVLRALRHRLRRRPPLPVGLRQPAAGPDARLRPGAGRLGHVRLLAAMAPRPDPAGDDRRAVLRDRVGPGYHADARAGAAAGPGHRARLDAGGARPDRPVPGLGVGSDAAAHPGRRRDDDQHRAVRRDPHAAGPDRPGHARDVLGQRTAGPWQLQVTVGATATFYTITAGGVIS